MPIWELRPTDLDHQNWQASTFKGRVVRPLSSRRFCEPASRGFHTIRIDLHAGVWAHYLKNQGRLLKAGDMGFRPDLRTNKKSPPTS